jgi:hypothetical protein
MTSPSNSAVQNLLPVQAYFDVNNNFVTFIGQGLPFTASISPEQQDLDITNSIIDSTTIGATTPSTGAFTTFSTTTGTIATQPTGATDIVNLLALQSYVAGISWKQPCAVATLTPITLSGLQSIDGYTTLDGDRVLVKNQANAAFNGIYLASAGSWTRSLDANIWDEFVSAISFIEYGTQAGGAWFCTATPGGTLGTTPLNWSQFTTSAVYSAGTGLTLTGSVFSITNTGVAASTYGSATATPVFAVNAQGQITSVTNTTITPAIGSVTGLGTGVATFLATPTSANLAAIVSDETGSGALVFATSPTLVTPALGTPASGDFSTGVFTWPTFNQNTTGYAAGLAGGASGSIPYQTAANTTAMLAKGTDGQILALAAGLPAWIDNQIGTVTSIATAGTVSGITLTGGPITTTGTITLGGTLDLSSPPAIGGTTANTIRGTTITATTGFVGTNYDAANSGGGALRNASGTSQLQWGGGGGNNITVDVAININPANAAVSIAPTGTGTVTINPATASTMNNVAIGGTTPLAGTFTDFRVNNTISLAGSTGTAGYLIQSNGASAPSWVNPASLTVSAAATATNATNAANVGITDDTTTNATMYPTWVTTTTGNLPAKTSSTKFIFNPSTGTLSATVFSGAGTSLTGTASSLTAGAVANSLTIGTGLTLSSGTTYNGSAAVTLNATGSTINSQTTGYTLVAADAGKTISITTGGVTVPNAVMSAGNIITIYNNSGSSQTITQGASLTLQWAGQSASSTGNRTLGLYGIATIIYISSSVAVISGAGLT